MEKEKAYLLFEEGRVLGLQSALSILQIYRRNDMLASHAQLLETELSEKIATLQNRLIEIEG
jgi:hypothetical protein